MSVECPTIALSDAGNTMTADSYSWTVYWLGLTRENRPQFTPSRVLRVGLSGSLSHTPGTNPPERFGCLVNQSLRYKGGVTQREVGFYLKTNDLIRKTFFFHRNILMGAVNQNQNPENALRIHAGSLRQSMIYPARAADSTLIQPWQFSPTYWENEVGHISFAMSEEWENIGFWYPELCPSEPPVCLVHGLTIGRHKCLYCCLCFKPLRTDQCTPNKEGVLEDVCEECRYMEDALAKPEDPFTI